MNKRRKAAKDLDSGQKFCGPSSNMRKKTKEKVENLTRRKKRRRLKTKMPTREHGVCFALLCFMYIAFVEQPFLS